MLSKIQLYPFHIPDKKEHRSMWDAVKGSPPDLKEKTPFTPYSGFTMGTPQVPLPGRGTSLGKGANQYDIIQS